MAGKGDLLMQNRQTLLLLVIALLLGINIGHLLSRSPSSNVNFLSAATAGMPTISGKDGKIYTCSEDGSALYEWRTKSSSTSVPDQWIATTNLK